MDKVLFITNIPSPYRVRFFNELGKYCQLTVLFETASSTERDESWTRFSFDHFEGIILKGIRTGLDNAFCPQIVSYIKKDKYDFIFVTGISSLTAQLTALWLHLRRIPYIYEGDGGVVSSTKGIKAWCKRNVIAPAELCLSTTQSFDEYCIAYGAKAENLRRYPFTSISREEILEKPLEASEKEKLKQQFGIVEEHFVLSVGRMVPIKGFDILLEACKDIDKDWGVYLIGGTAPKEMLEIVEKDHLSHIHFIDFVQPQVLRQYYRAADFFVLPTRYDPWGLVVNEAMAAGLPIITTFQCGAGMEVLKDGDCGYLYDAEDAEDLRRIIQKMCVDLKLRGQMSLCSLKKAKKYTIETMVKGHLDIMDEYKEHLRNETAGAAANKK